MSLFEEYLERLNQGVDDPLLWLGASLQPLDEIEIGLANRARRYVMDGDEPQLLLELPNCEDAGNWLGSPVSAWFVGSSWQNSFTSSLGIWETARRTGIARASWLNRQRCYRQLLSGAIPLPAIERVSRLLLAIPREAELRRLESRLPDWIFVLLQDGFYFRSDCVLMKAHSEPGLPRNVDALRALVEQAGGGVADLLDLLFERKGRCKPQDFFGLELIAGMSDLLEVESRRLRELLSGFSTAGRQALAKALQVCALKGESFSQANADLLAVLAVDDRKPTREVAQSGLGRLPSVLRQSALRAVVAGNHRPTQRVRAVELLMLERNSDQMIWLEEIRVNECDKFVINALDQMLSKANGNRL